MSLDIQTLFDEQLPVVLARNPEKAREINATYQLVIHGAGEWFLDLTSEGPKVERGQKEADCTLTMSAEDFRKLYEKPSAGMQLFFTGRLKIGGNPMIGMRLEKLFSMR